MLRDLDETYLFNLQKVSFHFRHVNSKWIYVCVFKWYLSHVIFLF